MQKATDRGKLGHRVSHSKVKQLDGQAKSFAQAINIANLLKKEEIF
jgi:hypothetical protein